MDIKLISKAFIEVAKQRKASGEPVYRAKLPDGKYVGYKLNAVKSKASALRMFSSPDVKNWERQIPLKYRDQSDQIVIERVKYRTK